MRPKIDFKPVAPHHSYMGIALIIFGLLMVPHETYGIFDIIFIAIGSYCIVDDILEHTVYGNTPLRVLFEKVIVPILEMFRK